MQSMQSKQSMEGPCCQVNASNAIKSINAINAMLAAGRDAGSFTAGEISPCSKAMRRRNRRAAFLIHHWDSRNPIVEHIRDVRHRCDESGGELQHCHAMLHRSHPSQAIFPDWFLPYLSEQQLIAAPGTLQACIPVVAPSRCVLCDSLLVEKKKNGVRSTFKVAMSPAVSAPYIVLGITNAQNPAFFREHKGIGGL